MKAVETWIVDYVLNSVWQVPLIFAAGWLAARLARPMGPKVEHRVWVGAVLAEAMLPACHLATGDLLGGIWAYLLEFILSGRGGGAGNAETRVVVGPGTVLGSGLLLPAWLLAAIAITYACVLLYSAMRLVWGLFKANTLLGEAQPVPAEAEFPNVLAAAGGVGADSVQILVSAELAGPVTLGIRRRALLLPEGFLEKVTERDLEAVLAHELAHIERRDFAKNLLYGVFSLPAVYHPALWMSFARLAETREMICDEIAAQAVTGRESYARSLLRLAAMLAVPMPARTLHAIGIFDAHSFERRVMNLTGKRPRVSGIRRLALVAGCAVVSIAACASALALRVSFAAAGPVSRAESPDAKRPHVSVNDVKIMSKVQPVYPKKAKEDKNTINGAVILTVIIGKEGFPEKIDVKQSLREDYDQSALDAVRQWRWEPYLLNGEPTEVETDVTVIYSIEQ